MSNPKQWLADLAMLPDTDAAQWRPVCYQHTVEYHQQEGLGDMLTAIGSVSGWWQTGGQVGWLNKEVMQLREGALPLAAEFFRNDTCWQLQALPRGRWQLDIHVALPEADAPTHLARTVRQLSVRLDQRLMYWQLWGQSTMGVPECHAAVLRAFEETDI
jgi:hypothetical protein